MIEDAIDPRPAAESFSRLIGAQAELRAAIERDPALIARNWNDRDSVWGNLRDLCHWIERVRD